MQPCGTQRVRQTHNHETHSSARTTTAPAAAHLCNMPYRQNGSRPHSCISPTEAGTKERMICRAVMMMHSPACTRAVTTKSRKQLLACLLTRPDKCLIVGPARYYMHTCLCSLLCCAVGSATHTALLYITLTCITYCTVWNNCCHHIENHHHIENQKEQLASAVLIAQINRPEGTNCCNLTRAAQASTSNAGPTQAALTAVGHALPDLACRRPASRL